MNRLLLSFKGSEMSRTDATVWFCPISSWQKWHLMGSYHTLKTSMRLKNLRVLARLQPGCHERLDLTSPRSLFRKKINYVEYSANDESEEEQETIASTEWIQNSKKQVTCPFGKKEPESYGFDITKADKIFDLLLSEGLIKLKPHHKIPSEDELKNMMYCKWHNATSHDTNECKVF